MLQVTPSSSASVCCRKDSRLGGGVADAVEGGEPLQLLLLAALHVELELHPRFKQSSGRGKLG